jgi:cell division septal protein FtsQ
VADAALRRTLPSTVEVFVSERQPMGIGRIGQELYLVDPRGMIIDEYGPNYADYDLPIIDGLAASPARDGTLIDATRARLAARLLQAVRPRPELARRISQIDVTDARDAVVILEGDSALIRLGDDQFLERLQSYLELAPALRERVPDIDYVDLRFDGRVYVRPVTDRDAPRSDAGLAAQAVAPPGRF